jgi:group I intron endonuclease
MSKPGARKIYLIQNMLTDQKYVGQTIHGLGSRWARHLAHVRYGRTSRLCEAIRKCGAENFSIQLLSIANSPKHGDRLEKLFIKKFRSNDPDYGYNMTDGGNLSFTPTQEVCEKNRLHQKGRPKSKEHARKISERMMGNRFWKFRKKRTS